MSKIIKRKWSSTLALTLVAIIFSAVALFMPWWSVNTSSEATLLLNSAMKTDYYLYQTVTAVKRVNDDTEIQTVLISNLTENQENVGELSFWLNATYITVLAGLGLSCLMLFLIVLPSFGRTFNRYLPLIGYIAAIVLFIAPIFLAFNFSAAVSKFSRLTPVNVPSTWTPISPTDIKGFWGGIKIQTNLGLPEWARSGNFWVWGPDAGWFLTFAASLLVVTSSLLTRTITRKKVEVE